MRLVRPHGGYGLGNELIPWAKAWLLAKELGVHCLAPAWGKNPRGYGRLFRSPFFDGDLHRVATGLLPNIFFTEENYQAIGIDDFPTAARMFCEQEGLHKKKNYIVNITGLWGAFRGLEAARPFLLSKLLNTRFTVTNLSAIEQWLSPRRLHIGFHILKGDFAQPFSWDYAGAVNMSWPDEWYLDIMHQILRAFGEDNVEFIICSNGTNQQLERFSLSNHVHYPSRLPFSDISDLLALAHCDLILPSMSTFSMWACFLSKAMNLWMKENLITTDNLQMSCPFLDSLRPKRAKPSAADLQADHRNAKSFAVGLSDQLPIALIHRLQTILEQRNSAFDLTSNQIALALHE